MEKQCRVGQGDKPPQFPTDDEIVDLLRRNPSMGMGAVSRKYERQLLSILKRLELSRHDAEDALQEVLSRLPRKITSFNSEGRLLPWLVTVVRRVALAKIRLQASRDLHNSTYAVTKQWGHRCHDVPSLIAHEAESALRQADHDARSAQLSAYIGDMRSSNRKRAVELYRAGATNAEIAAALGQTVNTIKVALNKVRNRLRSRAEAEHPREDTP